MPAKYNSLDRHRQGFPARPSARCQMARISGVWPLLAWQFAKPPACFLRLTPALGPGSHIRHIRIGLASPRPGGPAGQSPAPSRRREPVPPVRLRPLVGRRQE
jgi:hypothetical protein